MNGDDADDDDNDYTDTDDDDANDDDADTQTQQIEVDSMDVNGAGASSNGYAMDGSRLFGMSESQSNVLYTLLATGALVVLVIAVGVWWYFRRSSSWLTKHNARAHRLDTYDVEEEDVGRTSVAFEHEIEMENDVETNLKASFTVNGESENL